MPTVLEKINDLRGYRVENSHFRIGSKIHVSDFYFAKRLFQNSYFASRLAFLLAKDIYEEVRPHADHRDGGLTLIGYGLYSELLVSLIERFLKPRFGGRVNHDIMDDADEPQLLRGDSPPHKYVAIVVPIASAFSTSMKIENSLSSHANGLFREKTFLETHFNVLHVHDEGSSEELQRLRKTLGWMGEDENSKGVWVRRFFAERDDDRRLQKYLIRLPSTWHAVDRCRLCFPIDPAEEELPLFTTDRSSVTPDLIFTYPKERLKGEEDAPKFTLEPDHLVHGHVEKAGSHFRLYVDIEKFFHDNKPAIHSWLGKIKNDAQRGGLWSDTDRIVIIAPAQYSNASFVNKVNEVLFSDAATIIHYDSREDDIQNFQTFYEREVGAETKVFFVDDTITTGRTFLRTNYFVKHTRSLSGSRDKLTAAIILLDRSSSFVYKNISRKLEHDEDSLFAFAGLHIPLLRVIDSKCPLCLEKERYEELADHSYLDSTKSRLLRQAGKLAKTESAVKEEGDHVAERDHYLKKVEAMFRIVEWFSRGNEFSEGDSFHDWVGKLMTEVTIPFNSSLSTTKSSDRRLNDTAAVFLKTITYRQFTHYKPIRSMVFRWLMELIGAKVHEVTEAGRLSRDGLRDLKFLMRRAALMNSNFLIYDRFFDLLNSVLVDSKPPAEVPEIEAPSRRGRKGEGPLDKNLQAEMPLFADLKARSAEVEREWKSLMTEFVTFYAAQVKELCSISDSRCVYLERSLRDWGKKKDLSPRFKQVLRILRSENSIVIDNFWALAKQRLSSGNGSSAHSDYENLFRDLKSNSHYRYESLKAFLGRDDGVSEDVHLNAYLRMARFFAEESALKLNLREKTEKIVEGLIPIVGDPKKCGAFFIVRYRQSEDPQKRAAKFDPNDHFIAYNRSPRDGAIESGEFFSEKQDFLKEFFNGTQIANDRKHIRPRSTASVVELRRVGGRWRNAYDAEQSTVRLGSSFLQSSNRLLLVRFSRKVLVDQDVVDQPLGVAGFYLHDSKISKGKSADLFDPDHTRYLLLLRKAVSDFISAHHNNAEFRDWVEADKQRRVALLTGHGRETLMRFAKLDERYFEIVQTILFVQRLILDHKDETDLFMLKGIKGGKSSLTVRKSLKSFYNFKSEKIGAEYGKDLHTMARTIFRKDFVENTVPVEIETDFSGVTPFAFPRLLLDMICFELLVNAKKNRWIFDDLEAPMTTDGTPVTANRLWLTMSTEKRSGDASITIANTGPKVDTDTLERLFSKREIKDYDSTAGTKLIWTLLTTFGLGEVKTKSEEFAGEMKKLNVTLRLRNGK